MQRIKNRHTEQMSRPEKSNHPLERSSSILGANRKSHFLRQLRLVKHITPLDFEEFFPWVCLEWEIADPVSVMRISQVFNENKILRQSKSGLKKKSGVKSELLVTKEISAVKNSEDSELSKFKEGIGSYNKDGNNLITIRAYYDDADKLVKLSIIGCPVRIPQKLIRVLELCMPFHSALTELAIQKGGLSCQAIYEIAKLLPHSNLTNICFDDSFVPEGNYHLLLQEVSQLSCLSLNRCRITDEVCEKIAHQLIFGKPAANSLQILELASNTISNKGATHLARMLRTNRRLLHLNLADNNIDDIGTTELFSSLMQFCVTDNEIRESKSKRFSYLRSKQAVYDKCLKELMQKSRSDVTTNKASYIRSVSQSKKSHKRSQMFSKKFSSSSQIRNSKHMLSFGNVEDFAELFTKGLIGAFVDPFCPTSVVVKDECYYAVGNLVLCSLNLAYNNIHYLSVQKLEEVVHYQHLIEKIPPATGLMRIVLNGNCIPENCDELERIESYLRLSCYSKLLYQNRDSKSSTKLKKCSISFLN